MKIRSDYVSNSSSSSFILGQHEMFDCFHVTKNDILNALIDSYGPEDYQDIVMHKVKRAKEHPDWYKDELETGHWGPFWVYDLNDEKDRAEAIKVWGDSLEDWDSNYARVRHGGEHDGKPIIDPDTINKYGDILSKVCEVYDVPTWDVGHWLRNPNSSEAPCRWVGQDKPDPVTKCYGHREPLEASVQTFFKDLHRQCGIMTNLDVLKSDVARFFVHADDNIIVCGKVDEYGKNDSLRSVEDAKCKDWESEFCSFDRVCEVVYKYLVKIGRIKPDDPEFLKLMEVDPKFLSKQEQIDGEIYDFANGKSLTWHDLKGTALTSNLHEG